jgi:NADPH:quinone reductase-like Zn-dependent oxidoreductase
MLSRAVLSPFVSQRLTGVLANGNPQDLEQLAELAQSGLIKPVVDRNFSLADAARAIRYVEQCHSRGKVTLTIA